MTPKLREYSRFSGLAATLTRGVDGYQQLGSPNDGRGTDLAIFTCVIIATGISSLTIDTGANAVVNSDTLAAVGSGGLVIDGDLQNSGLLWANSGNLTVTGNVSGDGSAKIDGIATMEFGAAVDQDITFDASAAGTLKLTDVDAFTGVISGFDGNDHFDFSDIDFGADLTLTYVANQEGTGGTLK